MRKTRYTTLAAGALLLAIGACSASGAGDPSNVGPDDAGGDGGAPIADAGLYEDATFDFDAERPLVCGDAGFCETRLPRSDRGVPLSLRSIWVVSSDDVWSVTAEGYILHYDGLSWTTDHRTGHAFSKVWATSGGVWASGENGIVLHKVAGGAWTFVAMGRTSTIRAISGTSDEDVWFVREDGRVDHYDGTKVSEYPIDVPGIRITAVDARPGTGVYLAGYVKGPPPPPGSTIVAHEPYILAITPAGTSVFSSALREREGFVPVSIGLTGSDDDSKSMFVVGYLEGQYSYSVVHATLGSTSGVSFSPVTVPSYGGSGPPSELVVWSVLAHPPPPFQVWVHRWDDVVMPFSRDFTDWCLRRWNGSAEAHGSLFMGNQVAPRTIHGVHGNSADMWLVGDGFALKGAAQ